MEAVDPTVPVWVCVIVSLLLVSAGSGLLLFGRWRFRYDPQGVPMLWGLLLIVVGGLVALGGAFVPVVTASILVVLASALIGAALVGAVFFAFVWACTAWVKAL